MAEAIISPRPRAHNPEPCSRLTGHLLDAAGPLPRRARRPDGCADPSRP